MNHLFLVLSLQFCVCDKIFDVDADSIFKSIVGDFHNASQRHRLFADDKTFKPKKDTTLKSGPLKLTTIKAVPVTKYKAKKPAHELTQDDINKRRMNIDLARLLNDNNNPMPDFTNNADDPSLETRRFDEIRKNPPKIRKESLRELYLYYENSTELWIEKKKLVALMEHYIYETRYKLPYAQLLRIKYKDTVIYKIGYCFSLLRQLKQQQRDIYSTFKMHYLTTLTLHFHIKMYEKIARLDVDIRDVIQLIKDLDKRRKLESNPNYYDST